MAYIKNQLNLGVSQVELKNTLLKSGWKNEDIENAFSMLGNNPSVAVPKSGLGFFGKLILWLIGIMLIGGVLLSVAAGFLFYKYGRNLPQTVCALFNKIENCSNSLNMIFSKSSKVSSMSPDSNTETSKEENEPFALFNDALLRVNLDGLSVAHVHNLLTDEKEDVDIKPLVALYSEKKESIHSYEDLALLGVGFNEHIVFAFSPKIELGYLVSPCYFSSNFSIDNKWFKCEIPFVADVPTDIYLKIDGVLSGPSLDVEIRAVDKEKQSTVFGFVSFYNSNGLVKATREFNIPHVSDALLDSSLDEILKRAGVEVTKNIEATYE